MLRIASVGSVALLALASCGGAPPPPAAPAQTPPAHEEPGGVAVSSSAAEPSPKKAAALEKLTMEEASRGACDESHEASLEKLLADVEAGMIAKTDDDGKPLGMQVVGRRVLALGPNAKSFEMSVTGRGTEVHVLAYAAKDVSMDVLVGSTAATTLRSPHQRSATASPPAIDIRSLGRVGDVQTDSRQVTISPGQPLVVKLTGQGCAGIISFVKP